MANKTLQLLRNVGTTYASYEDALAGLKAKLAATGEGAIADGSPILARYTDTDKKERTLLGIKSASGYEIFDNKGGNDAIKTAIEALDSSVAATAADGNKYYVLTGVTEADGKLTAKSEVKLEAVAYTGAAADVAIADSGSLITAETVEGALAEIAAEIDGMDLAAVGGGDGDVITTVSEADGKVSASKTSLSDVKLTGYAKTNDTGDIAATDTVEVALSKLENKSAATTVKSTDKTVNITDNNGKDLSVNIDGTTLVKDSSTGEISSNLKIKSIAQAAGSAYASQYQLVYGNSETPIGDVISVAKDQFLKEASFNPSTQVLTLVMYNSTGGTTDITVDFKDVVIEAEAGMGLYVGQSEGVSDGTINIGIDANSESVTISDGEGGSTTAAVLTVGADSIKVDHIQDAINHAVNTATNSFAYNDTAESHKFVTEVDETNGIISVQRAQPTAGDIATTAIDGDSTHVAIAGTDAATQITNIAAAIKSEETARANAIAGLDAEVTSSDGTNVQVKVTEVDGVITAVNIATDNTVNSTNLANAIAALDSSVAATAEANNRYSVLTGVTQTDGVLASKSEVLLAAVAKTGTAADVAIADAGSYFATDTVEAALQDLAAFDCGSY